MRVMFVVLMTTRSLRPPEMLLLWTRKPWVWFTHCSMRRPSPGREGEKSVLFAMVQFTSWAPVGGMPTLALQVTTTPWYRWEGSVAFRTEVVRLLLTIWTFEMVPRGWELLTLMDTPTVLRADVDADAAWDTGLFRTVM